MIAGELPFIVLPPGERLAAFLDGVRTTHTYRGGKVDPKRVRVLQELAAHYADRRCTGYQGAFQTNGKDNAYIVLGIPTRDGQHEDVVAISPWSDEHATFVIRHDCGSKLPWTQVISESKREAKTLGAHRLVFRVNEDRGMDVYEAMLNKVIALLECKPVAFDHGDLHFDRNRGSYVMRDPDGSASRRGDAHLQHDGQDDSPGFFDQIRRWWNGA